MRGDPWSAAQTVADRHSLSLIRGKESGTIGYYDKLEIDSPAHQAAEEDMYKSGIDYTREFSHWRIWM